MTQLARVLAVIEQGPATSSEVALETGLPMRHCSAYLSELHAAGVLTRSRARIFVTSRLTDKHVGGYIYDLASRSRA